MKKTEIVISQKTLKTCVQKGGDLILKLDLDATQIQDFPQGNEIFIRSKKDDMPENYNDDVCLVANQNSIWVNGQSYWLKRASKKALLILYNQPEFMIDYVEFAKMYSGEDKITVSRSNIIVNSAMRHTNSYFFEHNIPLVIKRYNSIVRLEKICEA